MLCKLPFSLTQELLLASLAAVSLEGPRRCELAKLMANHIFAHQHFDVLATVVDHESLVDELGNYRASTCPGFDRFGSAALDLFLNFKEQLWIDVRAFFKTATHDG